MTYKAKKKSSRNAEKKRQEYVAENLHNCQCTFPTTTAPSLYAPCHPLYVSFTGAQSVHFENQLCIKRNNDCPGPQNV